MKVQVIQQARHARTHADTHTHTCTHTDTWHVRTSTYARTRMHTRADTHAHTYAHTHTYIRTHTHQNKLARTHTHARRHTNKTHAPKHAHAHTHADTHMARAEGSTPPRARQPGKRGDSGGWAEERERRGMGYSESIFAHTVISNTDNSRHEVPSKCIRNQFACMAHACMWTSRFLDVVCVMFMQTCTMNIVGHAQGDCIWITRSIALPNARKQNTRAGMGKARSGRCRACEHKEHAQVGAWRTQARNRHGFDVATSKSARVCRLKSCRLQRKSDFGSLQLSYVRANRF